MDFDERERLAAENRKKYLERSNFIAGIINPVPKSEHAFDVEIKEIKDNLNRFKKNYGLDLEPDFQRGHVWTRQQQIAYCEALIRDALGSSAKIITFNCAAFAGNVKSKNSDLGDEVVCMDGLQRLTAVQAFVDGEFKVFQDYEGGVDLDFFNNSRYSLRNKSLRFEFFFFQRKRQILQYYLAFNKGGTVHSESEISRVTEMLENTP